MIGQPQSHRRRPVLIAMLSHPSRQPQGLMYPLEVVIEELQPDQGIEGGIAFGEGVRLARKCIEPFDMHRPGWLHAYSQCGSDLHREESSMLITMLDRLCQGDRLWHDQRRTPPFARQHPLAIGPHQDGPIALLAIAEPGEGTLMGSLDRAGHRSLDQALAHRPSGAGDHEATAPILHEASPAFSLVRLFNCPFFSGRTTRTHRFLPDSGGDRWLAPA